MPCRLPGSATATRSTPPASSYGIATTRSSTCSGICSAASLATLVESQVDESDLVADGERAGDPGGGGDALVDDRLRERAVARPAAHERELVGGDQTGGGEQVGDELGHRVDRDARAETLRAGRGSFLVGRADGSQF